MSRTIGIDVIGTVPTPGETLLVHVRWYVDDDMASHEMTDSVEIPQKSGNSYKPVSQLNNEVKDGVKANVLAVHGFPVNSYDQTWYSGGFS